MGAVFIAITIALLAAACGKSEAQRQAEAERAKAEELERNKREQAVKEEFRKRDEEAARKREAMYTQQPEVEDVALEAKRNTLAKVARDPRAIKPTAIDNMPGEDFTTYEYDLPGIGHVMMWRKNEEKWTLVLSGATPDQVIAPPGALRPVFSQKLGNMVVKWRRIIGGPFDAGFVREDGHSIDVLSHAEACGGGGTKGALPALDDECNRYFGK
jgi:hypothetical protein